MTLRGLREPGGDSQMVVGVKLRREMAELTWERDPDVEGYVGAAKESFSGLVEERWQQMDRSRGRQATNPPDRALIDRFRNIWI